MQHSANREPRQAASQLSRHIRLAPAALILMLASCGAGAAAPNSSVPAAAAPSSNASARLASGVGQAAASAGTACKSQPAIVRVGQLGIMTEAGLEVAIRKGYFAAECIQFESTHFANAIQMIPPLSQNQLDVGTGGPGAAFFNAVVRDIGMRIVAVNSKGDPAPNSASAIVIRTDLWDQGKRSLKDLKGESIALVGLNSSQHINLEAHIEPQLGMQAGDLNKVVLAFPDMPLALRNRSIAAAMVVEPILNIILKQGLAQVSATTGSFNPNGQSSMLVFSAAMAQREDVANRFIVAYLRGVRDYVDAFKKDQNKEAMAQLLVDAKILNSVQQADELRYTAIPPNGTVNKAGLKDDQDWLFAQGAIPKKADLDVAIDNRFVDNALKMLGTYSE